VHNSGVKFEWDQAKAAANEAKHGITFEEAQEAFADGYAVAFPDDRHGEARFRLVGASASHLLVVIYTLGASRRGEKVVRIISAREAEAWEKKQYYEA
jgi:uncharacterized protein